MATSDHTVYSDYLKTRSRLGWFYRKFFLYPRLSKRLHGKTLDIGCGIGDFLSFHPDAVGVDINPKLVDYCKSIHLNAVLMNSDLLPFHDASFDSIILDNVLEHIQNPTPLINEIKRVLKSGGTLLIGVPGKKGYETDSDHKIFYTEDMLIDQLTKHSFSLKESFYTPLKSSWMDQNVRQYCLYSKFSKINSISH